MNSKKYFLIIILLFILVKCTDSTVSPEEKVIADKSQKLSKLLLETNATASAGIGEAGPGVKVYASLDDPNYLIKSRNSDGSWNVEFNGLAYYRTQPPSQPTGDNQQITGVGVSWYSFDNRSGTGVGYVPNGYGSPTDQKLCKYSVVLTIPNATRVLVNAYADWSDKGASGRISSAALDLTLSASLLTGSLTGQNSHQQIDGIPAKLYPFTVNIQGGSPPYNVKWEVRELNNNWKTIYNASVGNSSSHTIQTGGINLVKCTITDCYGLTKSFEMPIQNNIIYPQTMIGSISIVGNEPFTDIAISLGNGSQYIIGKHNESQILQGLYSLQGAQVRVYYTNISALPMVGLTVVKYERI